MVNNTLFQTLRGKLLPAASVPNAEGAPAYALDPRHALAQFAATGCLNRTFYASADEQLANVLALTAGVAPDFVARTAVYCRERGYMKDMPSLLAAALTVRGQEFLPAVFDRVVGNGKMLRNFVQIVRSGAVGRKSLGSRPKMLVQRWLNTAGEQELLSASIGTRPSLADVLKMVHPKPAEAWREAFFAWVLGKPFDEGRLPPATRAFLAYQRDRSQPVPDVPFQMLTALELGAAEWARIAAQGSWHMVRMNLNTFARHGVFEIDGMAALVAAKLADPAAVAAARAFPYQLLAAYRAAGDNIPGVVKAALQDALEASLANVPALDGRVVVCPDVSGSMGSAVSGNRGSASSAVRCIDVAGLMAAALLRKNPTAVVMPFAERVVDIALNERDTVLTNAAKLAAIGGGGTNCVAPLEKLNRAKAAADLVVYVSDNQSWMDARGAGATATMREWEAFRRRNPRARLVCIDIQPYATTQAAEREDILNVGGFSDEVFRIVAAFAAGQLDAGHWVAEIEAVKL